MKEKLSNIALQLWSKVPQKARDIFARFYTNKKIFWPITIAFGLLFLVLILGLLFGNKNKVVTSVKNTPAPEIQPTSQAISNNPLNDLKIQINEFDVKQSRLKPPPLNFDIRF